MSKSNIKFYKYKGKEFKVYFVDKEILKPAFGRAYLYKNADCYAEVREDLHPIVQSFVIQHELYHLADKATWWGVFGMELRANVISGLKNPFGLICTILATLFSVERFIFYSKKLKNHTRK